MRSGRWRGSIPAGRSFPGFSRSPPTAAVRRLSRRSRRPMLALADPAYDLADPRSGVADPDDLAGELERALDGLRPEYRLVFVLFHSQHLSYDEIALVVTRPIGTVKTWLRLRTGPACRRAQ